LSARLLVRAEEKFHNHPTRVLSKDGAVIDDILVMKDEDHLYAVSDQQVNSAPQGFKPTSTTLKLSSCSSSFLGLWQFLTILESSSFKHMNRRKIWAS
jgi:hypothetical protein